MEDICNAADIADIASLRKLIGEVGIYNKTFENILSEYAEVYDYNGLKKSLENQEIKIEVKLL